MQIASHYSHDDVQLALSGHWGPLISWMLVPLLKLGVPPLAVARIFMGWSAVFFLLGCLCLFRQFKIPRPLLHSGLWIAALLSVPWSVENITPDLLLGGLISFAFASLATPRWFLKPRVALCCGVAWGVAYLCKSVALPLGLLTSFGVAVWWWWKQRHARAGIVKSLALTLLGMALVSAPWIGVLSEHYGKFTAANSARYNHALAGPAAGQRLSLLDQGFHRPQTGRVTIWEDPPLPYPDWSPWTSWSNTLLQLRIIARNVLLVLIMLTSVSLTFPVFAAVAMASLLQRRNDSWNEPPAGWVWLPVVALGTLFLPNYLLIYEQRYFYCALPLLFVASAGMLSGDRAFRNTWIQRHGAVLLAISFLIPTAIRTSLHLNASRLAGECAHALAAKIGPAQLAGPVAGSGRLPGGRTGLYLAYLLQQPWFGDEPSPSAASFARSGARLIIVNRGSRLAQELAAHAGFRNLDSCLFSSVDEAGRFPLQVFENVPFGNSAGREQLHAPSGQR